jgi:hypothetical protein
VIFAPPFETGATQLSDTCPFPETDTRFDGAEAVVTGVAEIDDVADAPAPIMFVAVTRNRYGVPFMSPTTRKFRAVTADATVAQLVPPSEEISTR